MRGGWQSPFCRDARRGMRWRVSADYVEKDTFSESLALLLLREYGERVLAEKESATKSSTSERICFGDSAGAVIGLSEFATLSTRGTRRGGRALP